MSEKLTQEELIDYLQWENNMLNDELISLRRENKQLKKQVELLKYTINNHAFCPDCRDKLNGRCYRCACQALIRKKDKWKAKYELMEMNTRAYRELCDDM